MTIRQFPGGASNLTYLLAVDDNEYFAKFTKNVQKNLHIVFTMNPANPDFYNRKNSSPALFNRCIIDWFGDWPRSAQKAVSRQFTRNVEIREDTFAEQVFFKAGMGLPEVTKASRDLELQLRRLEKWENAK